MTKSTERYVVLVVLAVWALTILAPIVVRDFEQRPEVSVAVMAIIALIKGTPNKPDPAPPTAESEPT